MTMIALRLGFSAVNTVAVTAAGGRWDAMAGTYLVPDTAVELIERDQLATKKSIRAADTARASRSQDSTRTAGRLAGYSDAEIESAIRTSGGDDL